MKSARNISLNLKIGENELINKHILVGIQPSGKIHIGNYFGTLKEALKLQETNNVTFLIAQLHSLTTGLPNIEQTREELQYLGAKNIIMQSKENTALMWELACKINIGELFRITQYKEKKDKFPNAGILLYPVLMAADILLVQPDYVLVGLDQIQHLELTRNIAKKNGYKIPEIKLSKIPKVMSITDPTIKMSKIKGDKHCLYLFDNPNVNREKIKKAPTTPAGIENLKILAEGLEVPFSDRFSSLKNTLADKMDEMFIKI